METEGRQENPLADESREISELDAELGALKAEPQSGGETLHEADEFMFMSALLDKSAVLMIILDRQGRVRGFSRACEEATGYAFEEVWGRHIWDLLLIPEEVDLLKGAFEKLRAGHRSIEYESHWLTKNGHRRLIAWSSTALFDSKGSLKYVIATGMDMTERSRAESTLREREERYRRLVESSPDAILVHYRGNIVFANSAAVDLLGGSSPDEIIGKPVLDFVHPDNIPRVKDRLEKILERGTELPLIEDRLIRLDETEVHVEADSVFPFMYEGRPAIQVVAREVTAGKRRHEALRRAEGRLQEDKHGQGQWFKENVAAMYQATLDGRLVDCNKSFAQMLGYEFPEEALGLRAGELYLDTAEREVFMAELRERGSIANFELRVRRNDGDGLRVLESASLIGDEQGATRLVQGTLVEIPEYLEMEAALWDTRQMYDALVQISADAVIVTDLRGRVTEVSHPALELTGFERAEELIGKSAFQLIAPGDHEKAIAHLQNSLKEGVVRNTECTLLTSDGTRLVALLDTALIRTAQGKPRAFMHIARQRRDRQLAQEVVSHATPERPRQDVKEPRAVVEDNQYEDMARAIFDSCRQLVGAAGGYAVVAREDGAEDEVFFSEPYGLLREGDPLQIPVRQLHRDVHSTGNAKYRNGLSATEAAQRVPAASLTLENVLVAPLIIDERAVGLLGFANKTGGFTDDDARIASAFGELAGPALYGSLTMEALEASEARFRSVSEIADHAIITTDSRESIVSWNRGAEEMFGYSAEEAIGKRLRIVAPDELWTSYKEALSQVASAGGFAIVAEAVEMSGRTKDGRDFPLQLSLVAWKTGEGIFFTSSIHDITERRLAEDAVRQLAGHDPLTGLANRALFTDRLSQALASVLHTDERLAVILLDLDRFMEINHSLGHSAGDRLLQSAGQRLKGLVRTGDTVARLGGDEFMVLLPGIAEAEDAMRVARKVLEAFRKPFVLDVEELHITASVGIAIYPEDGEDLDTLIGNADLAMCAVKGEGGNDFQRASPSTGLAGGEGMVLVT
jgi:diguanylate cyclase (GGDEF)-like protein/PAS domain S-box-containing protein